MSFYWRVFTSLGKTRALSSQLTQDALGSGA